MNRSLKIALIAAALAAPAFGQDAPAVERWASARPAPDGDAAGMRERWRLKSSPAVLTVPVTDEFGRIYDLYMAREKKHVYFAVWARLNKWQMVAVGPKGSTPAFSAGGRSIPLDRINGPGLLYSADAGTAYPSAPTSSSFDVACTLSSSRYSSQVTCVSAGMVSETNCYSSGSRYSPRTNCTSVSYTPSRPTSVPRNEPVTFRLEVKDFAAVATDPSARLLLGDTPIPFDPARVLKFTPVNTPLAAYVVDYRAAFAALLAE